MTKVKKEKEQNQTKDNKYQASKQFLKLSQNILQCIKKLKISNIMFQHLLAFSYLSLNIHHSHPVGAIMKKTVRMITLPDGRTVPKEQFEFIEDNEKIRLSWKFKKMRGIKTQRQISRIIKTMLEKGLLIIEGDYIIINQKYFPTKGFVKVPIELNKEKIWSKGFPAITWVKTCIEIQKGPKGKTPKHGSRRTRYNHKKALDKLIQGVEKQDLEIEAQKIHLRDNNKIDFKAVDFWHTKKINFNGKDYLLHSGNLYQKPKDTPHVDVAFNKRGIKNRWIEYIPRNQRQEREVKKNLMGKRLPTFIKPLGL